MTQCEDPPPPLALKLEAGPRARAPEAAQARGWLSLEPPERTQPCRQRDLSLGDPVGLLTHRAARERIVLSQAADLWSFVTAAEGNTGLMAHRALC